jgi:hypothetical protein
MAKLLVGSDWYEALDGAALYEREFERVLLQKTPCLFPGYVAVPFKKTVYSDFDAARPDYALVEVRYRDWWVVEVEMGHHSLEGHVLPQVAVLARAHYGDEEAAYLARKSIELDAGKLIDLMKGQLPRVLVVVNQAHPEWCRPLRAYSAELAVFEAFRSDKNQQIYRFDGFSPPPKGQILSSCRADPLVLGFLRVDSPAALGIKRNESLTIRLEGKLSQWQRLDSENTVWLVPRSRVEIDPTTPYDLIRLDDGSLELRRRHGSPLGRSVQLWR